MYACKEHIVETVQLR